MRNKRRWRSVVAALMLAAFLPVTTTACFGKFQLTQRVYEFNQDIDGDKWIQWFAFLVLSIVPIYALSLVIDLVLANSVEFWSGSNPISSDSGMTKVVRGPDGTVMTLNRRGTEVWASCSNARAVRSRTSRCWARVIPSRPGMPMGACWHG
jgi:hypothetical protein